MIRVVVVDDSTFMRKLISDIINSDPELEVVGTAADGHELLDNLPKFKPDVITLDISMPNMDGLTTLKHIMDENPIPVVMISAISDDETTFAALDLGAVDFIAKTAGIISVDLNKKKEVILEKIKIAAKAQLSREHKQKPAKQKSLTEKKGIVIIGASTGGPKAIEAILKDIPAGYPIPIVIVQHLPKEYTAAFADRLNKNCTIAAKEIENDETLKPGMAYVAQGGKNLQFSKEGEEIIANIMSPKSDEITPNIDVSMKSAAKTIQNDIIGIILTGMGSDGAEGLLEIKEANGTTLVQDESTCTVPGMPRSAIKNNAASKVIPLSSMAKELVQLGR